MQKCTFCVDRLALGKQPACVDACPYFALDAGEFAELRARHPRAESLGAGDFPGIDAEHLATHPSLLVEKRPPRAAAALVLRRNGLAITHLRPVAGPAAEAGRERGDSPLPENQRGPSC